jgi:UDP-glucose 4-epimerase
VSAAYNEVFNVGADQPYTVNYLAEVVAQAFDVAPDVRHLPARNEVVDAYSDHAKAQRVFGQAAPVTLEEGVARMAAWAKGVGARKSSTFEGVEILRNMPPSWKAALEHGEQE